MDVAAARRAFKGNEKTASKGGFNFLQVTDFPNLHPFRMVPAPGVEPGTY